VGQGIFQQVAALAQQSGVHLVGSNLSLMDGGGFGNTAVFYNNRGESLGSYSKIHLFRLMDEDQFLAPGSGSTLVETPWGKVGLAICYDLRFPELFRLYALAGAKMVIIPAEWPYPRLMHWQTLLRARAIENQMFIVACNRVGRSKETDFFGHSCVIDPWGEVLVEGGEESGVETAVIDTDLVDEVRARIPVFADRRPEVYGG
ncbi:MAG: carbon-nitrogen family hydrolase, partial [Anaerolineales bacterium]|nr:carbon-nitrogen family hydrolase [Anaerolineales bacterium]